jgi:hypothetical protein
MLKYPRLKATVFTLMSLSLLACGASLEEYQKFATAGKEYAGAIDTLLITSGNYFVDANSEILLSSDLQEPEEDSRNYGKITEKDDEWLKLIGLMRQHTKLLKDYFQALEELATSSAPQEAQKATDNIFNQLNAVSKSIQGSNLIAPQVGSALSGIPEIILNQKIKGALRNELQLRKEAIYRELALQELVLKLLTIQLQGNLAIIRDSQDNRLVLPPYAATQPIGKPDEWIVTRRNTRTMTLSIEALNNANKASQQFKESFQLLLEDKFTLGRANALLDDISELLGIAEEIKQATNPKQEN